ncbi:hypothetical protein NDK47_13030 [Brevibacillus ruminantium]|uniref:Heme-binding protein Shr-like Hb-interacting domain-containing protein n=1 Tax=Brevibacillus ruminantium TaxID=2950604 RepID=A0ABY4WN85_9BACL|nr:hypothetical protein [Brevibacillus ruminantium]USG68144.1 hypothetical protein NDK47_13030 [Brevibacillus ruminantium]
MSDDITTTDQGKVTITQRGYVYDPGMYEFVIYAAGYNVALVNIEVPVPKAPPALSGKVLDERKFEITFEDDPEWRESITDVYDKTSGWWLGTSRVNKTENGKIILDVGKINKPEYEFSIEADGYEYVVVRIIVD